MRELKPDVRRILIWYGENGVWIAFARTQREAEKAYLKLFKMLDKMGFYWGSLEGGDQIDWHRQAMRDDGRAAGWLINTRSDRRYKCERVEFLYVETP